MSHEPQVNAIDIAGLGRRFGDRTVLRDLALRVAPGEFVALLGRSGSGKSTLLRILDGLDSAVTGEVSVARHRTMVFQEGRLLPWARVLPNVTLGLSGAAARERGREALREVGLADRARDWPVNLSGGEAQRVALARALVREPDLMMLDEPFGALDALTRMQMHELLLRLHRRHRPAVLLVTHDVDEAILLADRVVVLSDGRLVIDLPNPVPAPRRAEQASFAAFRDRLLHELGVELDLDAILGDARPEPPAAVAGAAPWPGDHASTTERTP